MRRRLGLIISTATLFQLCFMLLDAWLLPAEIFEGSLFLRGFGLLLLALAWPLCRHPGLPPPLALHLYFLAFLGNALVVVAFIGWCYLNDLAMRYDGLFLVLLFAFLLTGLSSRNLIASAWLVCLSYVLLMLWLRGAQAELYYESQFLLCAAVIGSIGSWQQERGQRQAWLDQQLLSLARVRAEQADQRTQRLLAAASHDLRQPLHALELYIEALTGHQSGDSREHLVRQMRRTAQELRELLNSLFDISRFDSRVAEVHLKSVSAAELVANLPVEFRELARREARELTVRPSPGYVLTDPILMQRIIRGLVSNALTHAGKGRVLVGFRRRGERLRLEVWDSGVGIPPEDQTRIFEEFYQIRNASRDRLQGLGLGLALIRRMCEAMGHAYGLRSVPGQGSVFWVEMENTHQPAFSRVDNVPPPLINPLQDKTILCVDDEPAILDGMTRLLSGWGCQVLPAANPAEAIGQMTAASTSPDLMICDYRLPGEENGIDLIRRIQTLAGRPLSALLITGDLDPDIPVRAKAAGIRMLQKPVSPATLRFYLVNCLKAVGEPEVVTKAINVP